ncbi:MAG: helix-turn-helix domain-containing protein [Planctomycetota bacterium]|nr:helix-turn-helix domain-containing protein [Planctomycetota bacterium]
MVTTVPQLEYLDVHRPITVVTMHHHGDHPEHDHDFTELVIVERGSALHCIGKVCDHITTGDVFVIPRGERHAYQSAKSMQIINILIDLDRLIVPLDSLRTMPGFQALFMIEPRLTWGQPRGRRLRLNAGERRTTLGLAQQIAHECSSANNGWLASASASFTHLAVLLARCYQADAATTSNYWQLADLLGHLESDWNQTWAVTAMAKRCGLSLSTFQRRFRQLTGHSATEFLIRLRIHHACQQLHHSDLAITTIALTCGFEDSNYFSRQFRRITGMSPSAYRRHVP